MSYEQAPSPDEYNFLASQSIRFINLTPDDGVITYPITTVEPDAVAVWKTMYCMFPFIEGNSLNTELFIGTKTPSSETNVEILGRVLYIPEP
jgi:hypothetical protein